MGASKFSTRWQASVASLASVEKYGQIGKWPWEMIGFNRIHIRIIMELVMAAFAERSESRISSPWGCMIVHGMHTCEGPRSTPVLRVITAFASRSRVVTASLAP